MMPLSIAATGTQWKVITVKGTAETRRHLADLGFVPDCTLSVVTERDGNLIVRLHETRIAISRVLASKIIGEEIIA